MLCGIEEVFWPLSEVLMTRPWKPLSPLAGFCPEHIHWLAGGLWTIPESLSVFYSLLSLVAVEYQGPIFCHMPHSLCLLLRGPSRYLSPNPPHPNPSWAPVSRLERPSSAPRSRPDRQAEGHVAVRRWLFLALAASLPAFPGLADE